jgi:hypothetical protein
MNSSGIAEVNSTKSMKIILSEVDLINSDCNFYCLEGI